MEAIFELIALSYRYPQTIRPALDTVSLSVGEGIHSVRGASGSGKSTLLRLSNGLVPHFHGGEISGTASSCGLDVLRTPVSELSQRVGFVFQDPEQQSVRTTVIRDCAVGLENAGVTPRLMRARVEEALESAGIHHLADRNIATLSGGEKQRLALAGALVQRPQLLVLDEPVSQLDDNGTAAFLQSVLELSRSGITILISHHEDIDLPFTSTIQLQDGHVITNRGEVSAVAPVLADVSGNPVRFSMQKVGVAVGASTLVEASLEVRAGEVVGITGANGSGKTTLLRTIAGFVPPNGGEFSKQPGRIAYLPQNPMAMLHRPSVLSEIQYTLDRAHSAEPAALTMDELQLTELQHRYPRDLSSGERQRVAVAAVAAGSPPVLLLDEPTRGMDHEARYSLIHLIGRLSTGGTTVLIASHDRELLAATSHRVFRIEDRSLTCQSTGTRMPAGVQS